MNTGIVLAYKGGTLANVHARCGNALVQAFGGAKPCASINARYTLSEVALRAGLLTERNQ